MLLRACFSAKEVGKLCFSTAMSTTSENSVCNVRPYGHLRKIYSTLERGDFENLLLYPRCPSMRCTSSPCTIKANSSIVTSKSGGWTMLTWSSSTLPALESRNKKSRPFTRTRPFMGCYPCPSRKNALRIMCRLSWFPGAR